MEAEASYDEAARCMWRGQAMREHSRGGTTTALQWLASSTACIATKRKGKEREIAGIKGNSGEGSDVWRMGCAKREKCRGTEFHWQGFGVLGFGRPENEGEADICRRLLEKPVLIEQKNERNETFIRDWILGGHMEFLHLFLGEDVQPWSEYRRKVISNINSMANNALHDAVQSGYVEAAKLLIKAWLENDGAYPKPWLQENNDGQNPLLMALMSRKEEMALELLKNRWSDPSEQCEKAYLQDGVSPLFLSIQMKCPKVANKIIELVEDRFLDDNRLHSGRDGQNPLHVAIDCPKDTVETLIKRYPQWADQADKNGNKPIDKAVEADDIQLIKLLENVDGVGSWMSYAPKAWTKACIHGHSKVLRHFMQSRHDTLTFWTLCDGQKDTPLHYIKFKNANDYEELFQIPGVEQRKDVLNSEGETPLHVAITNENLVLVELLIEKNANLTIPCGKDKKTAIQLLAEKCQDQSPEWDTMCKRKNVFPRLKLKNILPETNLDEMRSTMSVIAALLATITFAAGFQIPGGLNNNIEYATLGKKAAFIVFSLSDTFAMCCSMLALFNLIWTMGLNKEESRLLIDRTVNILQFSLVGTLLAFMTGVFLVVAHQTLWVAIVIIVLCSVLPLICNKTILRNLFLKYPCLSFPMNYEKLRNLFKKCYENLPLMGNKSIDSSEPISEVRAPDNVPMNPGNVSDVVTSEV